LRKLLHSFQPDVVHSHYGTVTAFFAAISHARPLVITYHGSDLNYLKGGNIFTEFGAKIFSQVASLRAAAIICVSEKLKQKLWWRKKKVFVLPMGVDENFFKPIAYLDARNQLGILPGEKVILFNYGNTPLKRKDIAETALAIVKTKYPETRLWVLNNDATPGKMLLLFNASDCLLLCSDSEGGPTIVKEAMACNLPVVSSDVGDVRQTVDQTFPHVVTDQDPKNLAQGIEEVFRHHKRSNGREILISRGLTEQSLSGRVLTIYKTILGT
jgi:glycosyltransferase involved in cell wall biosynthesis